MGTIYTFLTSLAQKSCFYLSKFGQKSGFSLRGWENFLNFEHGVEPDLVLQNSVYEYDLRIMTSRSQWYLMGQQEVQYAQQVLGSPSRFGYDQKITCKFYVEQSTIWEILLVLRTMFDQALNTGFSNFQDSNSKLSLSHAAASYSVIVSGC